MNNPAQFGRVLNPMRQANPNSFSLASAVNRQKKDTRLAHHMRLHGDILIAENSIPFSNPT